MALKDIALRYLGGVLTTSDPVALGSSLTVAGTAGLQHVTASGNVHGIPAPKNQGLAAWTWDGAVCSNSQVTVNGTVYLMRMFFPETVTIATLYWHVAVVGVTPTAGQNEVGLYSSTGTKLASVNVDSLISSTGTKASTITGQVMTAGSTAWVAVVFNAATPPQLARGTGLSGAGGLINVGLSPSGYRFAINGTGQTVLPSSVTPSAHTQGVAWWAAAGT